MTFGTDFIKHSLDFSIGFAVPFAFLITLFEKVMSLEESVELIEEEMESMKEEKSLKDTDSK
jgi:cytochrome c biogenesis protein CcdA